MKSNILYNIMQKYVGKSLYKTASNLGVLLLKQVPQAEFWENSEFNRQCPSRLLNLCRDGQMRCVCWNLKSQIVTVYSRYNNVIIVKLNFYCFRISTCSKATMSNFLAAHKDVGKILFNQMIVESTPILNTVNRYSGKKRYFGDLSKYTCNAIQ